MDKAICAITLSTSKPMLVEAVWHKGNLTLLSEQTLPADRKGLLDVLPNIIHEIEKNGDDVLVDERSGFFSSTGGKHIQFAAPGTSGKPILVESLDLYRELSLQKAIIRPKTTGAGQRYTIPDNIIDDEHDTRGQAVYRIDWERLKSEHLLMLLCVYGTIYQNVASASYIEQMYSSLTVEMPPDPLDPLRKIVRATEAEAIKSVTMSPLTGKGRYL